MKTIFKINFIAQMVILGIAITALILSQPMLAFMVFFFGLGTWQLLTSVVITLITENQGKLRSRYMLLLGIVVIYSLTFLLPIILRLSVFELDNFLFYYLFSMIPIGFGMAVFNAYISYHELIQANKTSENQFLNL
jgi:MFS family permease